MSADHRVALLFATFIVAAFAYYLARCIREAWREDMARKEQADAEDALSAADWQAEHGEAPIHDQACDDIGPLFAAGIDRQTARLRAELEDDEATGRWLR